LLSKVVPALGIEVSNADLTDIDAYLGAFVPGKTKLVMLESPTNPRMQVRASCLWQLCLLNLIPETRLLVHVHPAPICYLLKR
jgi:hypothetical protein